MCTDLLSTTLTNSYLIQRTALHWAAIEKRAGFTANAHMILHSFAPSQNPDEESGELYWQLWESLCESADEFEVLVKCRQHIRVKQSNREGGEVQ